MAKRGRKRIGGLAGLSWADLRRELARRERRIPALVRARKRLMVKVADLGERIEELGGMLASSARHGGGRRPRNEMNLADSLARVLKGKTMSVGEAMEAVQKSGYRSNSKHFRVSVNIALAKDKRFKRVGRGQYTTK